VIAFAPNISWLFPELPFADRPRAVAQAGFRGLEFGFQGQADLQAIRSAQDEYGLEVVLFNQDVAPWDEAHRGYLADPALRGKFWRSFESALGAAEKLGAMKLMLPVGVESPTLSRDAQLDCIVENLREAAPPAARANVILTIEILNPQDYPGYFLRSSREALDIVRRVDHPSVKLQLDTYHFQILEGHVSETLAENIGLIVHIQFGDVPDRCEPGTGTGDLDFARLIEVAERGGYSGYVGLEYIPRSPGVEALAWVPAERRSPGFKR
jgi:hydroxypyruvate isomerase